MCSSLYTRLSATGRRAAGRGRRPLYPRRTGFQSGQTGFRCTHPLPRTRTCTRPELNTFFAFCL